jgi:uncharacterized protein
LADTEDTWAAIFPRMGMQYQMPKLVLFSEQVSSACGYNCQLQGLSIVRKVYLDLGFFRELDNLGAAGDFAQAYVIGHEFGHHVQNLLGISGKVHDLQIRSVASQASVLILSLKSLCKVKICRYFRVFHNLLFPMKHGS